MGVILLQRRWHLGLLSARSQLALSSPSHPAARAVRGEVVVRSRPVLFNSQWRCELFWATDVTTSRATAIHLLTQAGSAAPTFPQRTHTQTNRKTQTLSLWLRLHRPISTDVCILQHSHSDKGRGLCQKDRDDKCSH
jgi:hypothetical protein